MPVFRKDIQFYKFCAYGFLKNLRFFEPFLLLFLLEKELGFLQVGILYSIREISRNVFEIPAGIAADVLGRRRTMISSFSLYILSFLGYTISENMILLSASTILFGLGEAFRTGTHKAMIFDYLKENGWERHKVSYYGHTRSWSQAGSAVSALVAAALVFYSGRYENIFLCSCIPYVLGLFLLMSYPARLDGLRVPYRSVRILKNSVDTVREIRTSFRKKGMLRGMLSVSSYGGYVRAVKDYLQPAIRTFALGLPVMASLSGAQKSAVLIGIIYFIVYLLSSFITRRSGRLSGRAGGLNSALNLTLMIGFAGGMISGLFYGLDLLPLSILFFVLIYLVENLRMPAGIAWFADHVRSDVLATSLSVESQGKSLFTVILALGMGLFADLLGPGPALLLISLFMLLLVPLFWLERNASEGTPA